MNQVKRNAQALANALLRRKCRLVAGGTDNHLLLWDLTGLGITEECQKICCRLSETKSPSPPLKPFIVISLLSTPPPRPHRQHQHGQCTSGLKAQQQRRHRQLRGRVSEAPFLQVQKRGPVAKRTPGPTTLLHNASVATTPASTSSLHLLNPAPGLSTPPRQVHLHHCRIVPKQKLVPARFEVRMYLGMPWWLL
ncbi:hypothetical protein ACFX2I_025392 [Malus domestica]